MCDADAVPVSLDVADELAVPVTELVCVCVADPDELGVTDMDGDGETDMDAVLVWLAVPETLAVLEADFDCVCEAEPDALGVSDIERVWVSLAVPEELAEPVEVVVIDMLGVDDEDAVEDTLDVAD